ncbi:CsbD family protein [Methylobacterium sp. J-070]|uniref:CsbD family protein n=1 Tax=Methylobacterium sp. J-070 TaxID=2836650 RepID=UPI001FBBD143|nr:CsbD family protein [Methylobacterium sp. J-070]MCJ2048255.1 CsbD family protein [Methylobacterium sp. J-070]
MTEDKSPPSAKRRAGSVKEAIGKITGDVRVEAEGARQKRAARPKAGGSGPPDPDRR